MSKEQESNVDTLEDASRKKRRSPVTIGVCYGIISFFFTMFVAGPGDFVGPLMVGGVVFIWTVMVTGVRQQLNEDSKRCQEPFN